MYRWVWVVFVAGCIEPNLLPCGEQLCTSDAICEPDGRCVTTEQLVACTDKVDDEDCIVGASAGKCVAGVCSAAVCGNGVVEIGETCDDGNRASSDGCSFDCNSHETCGNGIVDFAVGEQCDDGNTDGNDACEAGCKLPRCGDGIVNASIPEGCDDGNRVDGDGCSRDCLSNETCGNAIRDPGEECDDGNVADHDGCQSNCKVQRCGDDVVDSGEQCDDGNFDNTDACLNTCRNAKCTDGFVWVGHEQCDDGNLNNSDLCPTNCVVAHCGDGFFYSGHEACDDGNQDETDCCHNNCTQPICGDGIRQCAERCDDGNLNETDSCRASCRISCPAGGPTIDWENFYTLHVATDVFDTAAGTGGEFGGQTYAFDVTNEKDYWVEGWSDGSTTVDLAFTDVGFNDQSQNYLTFCSTAGGSGTWNPGLTAHATDICGNPIAETIPLDPVVAGDWPSCGP